MWLVALWPVELLREELGSRGMVSLLHNLPALHAYLISLFSITILMPRAEEHTQGDESEAYGCEEVILMSIASREPR